MANEAETRSGCGMPMFLVAAALTAFFVGSQPDPRPAAPPPEIHRTPQLQEQRRDAIADAIKANILTKVEPSGHAVNVWVGRRFSDVPIDAKRGLVGLIYAYHFTHETPGQRIRLRDGYTDKPVGHFTVENGLILD